jgi:hypothetical protein
MGSFDTPQHQRGSVNQPDNGGMAHGLRFRCHSAGLDAARGKRLGLDAAGGGCKRKIYLKLSSSKN